MITLEKKKYLKPRTFHPKELQKEEQGKSKASKRQEIIKIKREGDANREFKEQKINEINNWVFENINKSDKALA